MTTEQNTKTETGAGDGGGAQVIALDAAGLKGLVEAITEAVKPTTAEPATKPTDGSSVVDGLFRKATDNSQATGEPTDLSKQPAAESIGAQLGRSKSAIIAQHDQFINSLDARLQAGLPI